MGRRAWKATKTSDGPRFFGGDKGAEGRYKCNVQLLQRWLATKTNYNSLSCSCPSHSIRWVIHTHRQHRHHHHDHAAGVADNFSVYIGRTIARSMESPERREHSPSGPRATTKKRENCDSSASACSGITSKSNTMLDIVCECVVLKTDYSCIDKNLTVLTV